ncbi:MAG: hypothetical protein ABMA13_23050 [Chthoniobacteraceae bacterium]
MSNDDTLLAEIRELIGEANFDRNAAGWVAKEREDAACLRECFEQLKRRLAMPGENPIENPGGWLHATYHQRREEVAEGNAS